MKITVNQEKELFKLDTPKTSLVLGLADGKYLGQLYYGRRVRSMNFADLWHTEEYPGTPESAAREEGKFEDVFAYEYPASNNGNFNETCLSVSRPAIHKNGHGTSEILVKPTFDSFEILNGKPDLEGLPHTFGDESSVQSLKIVLRDVNEKIRVELLYSAFADTDVITKSVKIVNEGEGVIYLNKALSACMTLNANPEERFEVLTLHGAWARERHMERVELGVGAFSRESYRGVSGHQENPFMALLSRGTTCDSGEVYAMHFVYSGNFLAKAIKNQFSQVRMVMGIHPEHFCWKLSSGESFQTPEVVMTYSASGLSEMTRSLHTLYRNHLIRGFYKDRRRPILINNWEATYFDFDSEKLQAIAEEAAKSGIEMLVMDDGWFGHRNGDDSSLGDWYVNEAKLTGGLKPLVDAVNKAGLKFGIWFEPENISPDSDVYRAHPDWVYQYPESTPVMVRHEYTADFCNPEVTEYVYSRLKAVLESANVEYVKWDMNRPITEGHSLFLPPDRQGEVLHRHILAVYAMQERLLKDFPQLLLENCTAGGGRFDPGMLYYSPQFWCSDDTDAVERLAIQEGTQLLYPLSTIGAHVSDVPNHTVGRVTPFATRGLVAMGGTFGYELDITKISDEDRAQIPVQVKLMKEFSELIRTGEYYRLASYRENNVYDSYMVVSNEKNHAVVFVVQVLSQPNEKSHILKLKGLKEEATYEVREVSVANGSKRLWGTYSGDVLMYAGLIVAREMADFTGLCLELTEIL